MLLDVDLPDHLTKQRIDGRNGAAPRGALLLGTLQQFAVELEVLVVQPVVKQGRPCVENQPAQVVLPGVDGGLGDNRIEFLEVRRHHQDQAIDVGYACLVDKTRPVEVRHDLVELIERYLVVIVRPFLRSLLGDMRRCDARFQVNDLGGSGSAVVEARKVEHGRDM